MPLPLKALCYGQLIIKTEESGIPASGHAVSQVDYKDTNGITKAAFYKPLAPDYPALLAKYAVAASVAMRLSLGERVAEERLVFNDKNEIVGTVSFVLPNFLPLYGWGQILPVDPEKKELVCPSAQTLLHHNVAELLVSLWCKKEDDTHPGNNSIYGIIDRDMTLYHITHIMKGVRSIDIITGMDPEEGMRLKKDHLNNFPNITGRTHWPANSYPRNGNIYKHYLAAEAFQSLAGLVDFQVQMFSALLKELITFDPEMLRLQLNDYFGDLPLDYLSLDKKKSDQLIEKYPKLFNHKTDKLLFIEHMGVVYQDLYNELYRVVVFYSGCKKNNAGIPVVSYSNFLRNKPSAYKNITFWASKQNKKMETEWNNFKANKKSETAGTIEPVLDAYCVNVKGRYDLAKMERRYHKIWRDAHYLSWQSILDESEQLANDLASFLGITPLPFKKRDLNINETTEVWQFLEDDNEESHPGHTQPSSSLHTALLCLKEFIKKYTVCGKNYYQLPCEKLSPEANQQFIASLEKLLRNCEKEFYNAVGKESWGQNFAKIAEDLQSFYGGLHFQRRLLSSDSELNARDEHDCVANRKHTDEEVVALCLNALFDWVNALDKELLNDYINGVIQVYVRTLNFMARRERSGKVQEYLKRTDENGENCLATILSVGGCSMTSLNTLLITRLIPYMLDSRTHQVDVNLLSVHKACEQGQFDAMFYTEKAREFVLNEERFTHIYSKKNIRQFYQLMYEWVAQIDRRAFKEKVDTALTQYMPYSFNFFSPRERDKRVCGYFGKSVNFNNTFILASIFAEGGIEKGSLNFYLLDVVLTAMKKEISTNLQKASTPQYNRILQVEIIDRGPCPFLTSLAYYAKLKIQEESACSSTLSLTY